MCDCLHPTRALSEQWENRALTGDICSSIYASEDTERYLLKHMLRKSSSVPGSIAQLSNTLEYGPPSLPRCGSKILMSSFDHSVPHTGICQELRVCTAQRVCCFCLDSVLLSSPTLGTCTGRNSSLIWLSLINFSTVSNAFLLFCGFSLAYYKYWLLSVSICLHFCCFWTFFGTPIQKTLKSPS